MRIRRTKTPKHCGNFKNISPSIFQMNFAYPILFVQIPIIPHRGMKIVKTFVTMN